MVIAFLVLIGYLTPTYAVERKKELILLDNNNDSSYIEFMSTDLKDYFHPERMGKYPSTNLFDGYFKTCWVAGSTKTNNINLLYMKIPQQILYDKIILNIFSGYGKSKKLYFENARPKTMKLSILSVYSPNRYKTEVATKYLIKKKIFEKKIVLKDRFKLQSFQLNIKLKNKQSYILKLEIIDTYKGSKYNDICISEIFFNNRFVTKHPNKYKQVKDILIKNENTFVVNYKDSNATFSYNDNNLVFTMVDWQKKSNWAILYYVDNNEIGRNSRVEESTFLLDLRNRKIVNNNFKKETGVILHSPFIEKDKSGKIFLNTFNNFNVELK